MENVDPAKVARVAITRELMARALRFPDGTYIWGVALDERGNIEFAVAHPDLPESEGLPPLIEPLYTVLDDLEPAVKFVGWGHAVRS